MLIREDSNFVHVHLKRYYGMKDWGYSTPQEKYYEDKYENDWNDNYPISLLMHDVYDIRWNAVAILSSEEVESFKKLTKEIDEQELEKILESDEGDNDVLDGLNGSGSVEDKEGFKKVRSLSRTTIDTIKDLYDHCCQICEESHTEYGASLVQAHHITPFSESFDNSPENIMILCPTHHEAYHKGQAVFDRENETIIYANGKREVLSLNEHL